MRSFLGMLCAIVSFVSVIGGGALIWHLSSTVEMTRTTAKPAAIATPSR